jgi:hypothetical protein
VPQPIAEAADLVPRLIGSQSGSRVTQLGRRLGDPQETSLDGIRDEIVAQELALPHAFRVARDGVDIGHDVLEA